MSNSLKEKHQNALNALKALKQMMARDINDEAVQDSIIKRFEFTVELCWKLYKRFFELSSHKLNSPKSVFRELLQYEILNEDEIHLALEMIDARNTTAHEYNATKAKDLIKSIPLYAKLLEKMLNHNALSS